MTNNEVISEGEESKASGCSTLIKVGMVILGFIVALQVLDAFSDFFGETTTLCCVGLIVIAIVIYVVRGRRKEKASEPESLQAKDPLILLEDGKLLHSQGKREQAVAAYRQAYQEGSPAVRDLAIKALDELGEVEKF